jgi:phage terminase large subunit-like protein
MKDLLADPKTAVIYGSSYENRENLSPNFLREIERHYGNTHLGKQEIEGKMIEDAEGALWNRHMLDQCRVVRAPEIVRIVVAVDPSVTNNMASDETGIVVVGLGVDDHAYVLADYTLKASPLEWAQTVVTAYYLFKADRVVGEVNNGGDLIEQNIRTVDPNISYKSVHATRGKYIRAEPIASLYEQVRAHHVGHLAELEDELCTWEPGGKSPNRLDAVVWGITELALNGGDIPIAAMPATSASYTLPPFYVAENAEGEEKERLEQQQQRVANILQDVLSGRFGTANGREEWKWPGQ